MGRGSALIACLTILNLQLVTVFAYGGGLGGPSTFGYDAASACGKPITRHARTYIETLPCDFRRDNWCTVAGSNYPWHAVRRFVQENQGLMRRMYGDEKHINILKSELEKNDVEVEEEDIHNYYQTGRRLSDEDPLMDRSMHSRYSDHRQRRKSYARSMSTTQDQAPKERVTENSSTETIGTVTPAPSTSGTPTMSSPSPASPIPASPGTTPEPPTTTEPGVTATITTPPASSSESPSATGPDETVPTTSLPVSLAQIADIRNLSINEVHGLIDRFDANVDELTELSGDDESAESESAESPEVVKAETAGDSPSKPSAVNQPSQFRPRPEYRPQTEASPGEPGEAQLYQDVAAKDKQEPVLKVQGINACPVKEEVVAPFWANNTRGEVLALLNLYPFEQYVHWEKCTHENKQMYCRDGCRCEQQYRLHRLLAYDPNNECRGIFSDWFKFPSCCICRCYSLPLEFRVTSRSPRGPFKQKVKVRSPRSQGHF